MENLWRGGKARGRDKGKEGDKVTGVCRRGQKRDGWERGWEREAGGRRKDNSMANFFSFLGSDLGDLVN